MKKRIHRIATAFLFSLLTLASFPAFAFDPPPPPPNGGNGDTPPPGGGAPIQGGVVLLIGLAASYALYKINLQSKEDETVSSRQYSVSSTQSGVLSQ
ncbi:MAG: hypothetical protein K9H64_23465 [Bacteroidales bacterium]|nr:hypothetical protein [Bacteroidales bacterium]MCF8458993.1 hypothetical protein [Bacteroidales bacterium]